MAGIVGIIPVMDSGKMKFPFPSELMPIGDGEMLVDLSLKQLWVAGISDAYIVCPARLIDSVASFLGKQRHGVNIRYFPIAPDESQAYGHFVVRGARRAGYFEGFSKFVALDPHFQPFNSIVVSYLVKDEEAPIGANVPGLYWLDEGAVTALRKALKLADESEAWEAATRGRKSSATFHFDSLNSWDGIQDRIIRGLRKEGACWGCGKVLPLTFNSVRKQLICGGCELQLGFGG